MHGYLSYIASHFDIATKLHYFRIYASITSAFYETFGIYSIFIIGLRIVISPTLSAGFLWISSIFWPRAIYKPISRKMITHNPLISFVIAGLNEENSIGSCLESILRCGYGNIEIIFVSDGSTDNTLLEARRVAQMVGRGRNNIHQKVRVFAAPRTSGKPNSANYAISRVNGEFTVLMDCDTRIQYGTVQHWLKWFQDPRNGGVASNTRAYLDKKTLVGRLQEVSYALSMLRRAYQSKIQTLVLINGAAGMFRTSVLRDVGGFDPGLGDDLDLSRRIMKAGWRIVYDPQAAVWTGLPDTWGWLRRQRSRWARNSVKIGLNKHRDTLSPRALWMYRWNIFVISMLRFAPIIGKNLGWWALMWLFLYFGPFDWMPALVTFYLAVVAAVFFRVSVSRDLTGSPPPRGYLVVPLIPFFNVFVGLTAFYSVMGEILKLFPRHAYTPKHVFDQAPQW